VAGIQKSSETVPTRISQEVINYTLDLWRQAGKRSIISITGGSMVPLVLHGDQVLVSHGLNGLRTGDLIVFRQSDQVIAHRIIRIRRYGGDLVFVTKGDNSLRPDPFVNPEEIIGRVVGIVHNHRIISIDNRVWRWAGWLIAAIEFAWLKLANGFRYAYRRLFRHEPNPVISRLVRLVYLCFSLPKHVIRLLLIRS